jgi:PadR family transcriptional regulator PadR
VPRKRLGMSTLAVLRAIDAGQRYGFEIMEQTGLPGGTVYPALARLEEDELLTSDWEDAALAQAEKRPPRRYYDITDHGRERLQESLAWIGGAAAREA